MMAKGRHRVDYLKASWPKVLSRPTGLDLAVAKKARRSRKFRRYLKGNVDETLSLTTLAAKTLVGTLFDETPDEKVWISSLKGIWSIADFTPAAGDGPILVGVAHGDYSDAEVEEVIENTGSWSEGDLVQSREIAKRLVRQIGVFDAETASSDHQVLNDGKPITTKLGWLLTTGKTLRIWAYNLGDSALATTVPQVRVNGHVNLWPQ